MEHLMRYQYGHSSLKQMTDYPGSTQSRISSVDMVLSKMSNLSVQDLHVRMMNALHVMNGHTEIHIDFVLFFIIYK